MTQSDLSADPGYITRQYTAFTDASYQMSVHITGEADSTRGVGLNIDKVNPTDHYYDSGYTAVLRASGNVFLYKAGVGVVVGDTATGTDPTTQTVPIRVDQSGAAVTVTVGNSAAPQIQYLDPGSIYPGGWTSFVTFRATAVFSAPGFSSNVADSFAGSSGNWVANSGAWSPTASGYIQSTTVPGVTSTATLPNRMQGSGSTTVQVQLSSPSSPTSWAGLLVDKAAVGDEYTTSGYQVELKANGNLSLSRAGLGTVVPDIATGTNPTTAPVTLRIVASQQTVTNAGVAAVSFQIFVGSSTTSLISWSDTSASRASIGFTSLDTSGTGAQFNGLAFDAMHG